VTHAQETFTSYLYQKPAPMHVTKIVGLIGRLCFWYKTLAPNRAAFYTVQIPRRLR